MRFHALPSRELLLECVDLDERTGALVWRNRPLAHFASENAQAAWNARWAGKPAFASPSQHGYAQGWLNGHKYFAHRIVWKILTGEDPQEIDHIDGNRLNNSPANLRSVERAEQLRNTALRSDNKTGHHGVHWDRGRSKWMVTIKRKSIGRFATFDEAVRSRKAAEAQQGFHANHGRSK